MKTLQERLESKFARLAPDVCWLWKGAVSASGYGGIRISREYVMLAHRASYEAYIGPIPPGTGHHGMCVCHTCDNPLCVNPAHLFLGTHSDNMIDMVTKGRQAVNTRRGETNNFVKLTDGQVAEIIALGGTMLQREIGAIYGVTQTHISRILRGAQRTTRTNGVSW